MEISGQVESSVTELFQKIEKKVKDTKSAARDQIKKDLM